MKKLLFTLLVFAIVINNAFAEDTNSGPIPISATIQESQPAPLDDSENEKPKKKKVAKKTKKLKKAKKTSEE